ncbi:hypothetical protein EKO04_001414 [Ascochyta lentis]|uniref:Uncharacterized protein n=1 Tax=Ascochyta lentis TaxID=205686 RepID=A0A8H7JCV4_9PLEO|nr:hypothetical protein EKO04_001414 [Ascochyta lentis]
MSQQNYHFDPRDYDTYAPARNPGAHEHNMPIRRSPYDEMNSRSGSFLSSTSLYTNPPSPALRPGIPPYTQERYTTLEGGPRSITAAAVDYIGASRPQIPGRYPSATRAYQACPPVNPNFEPSHLSLTNVPYRPRTPPMTLPPLSLDAVHQRPPGLTHPLPEPLPRYLRVEMPDSPSSTLPRHTMAGRSSTGFFTTGVEKMDKTEKLPKAPVKDNNKSTLGRPESVAPTYEERHKMRLDLQDMTKKLETAFQDPRMNPGEVARKKKMPEQKLHCAHLGCDTHNVRTDERLNLDLPPLKSSVAKVAEKMASAPKPGVSNSTTLQAASSVSVTPPVVNKVEEVAPKTILGSGYADSTRFIDFVERQRASWAFHVRNSVQLGDQQKKLCERATEAAKNSQTQWRSGADRVSNDLGDIEKKLQPNSKIPVCSKTKAPKLVPNTELVNASSVRVSDFPTNALDLPKQDGKAYKSNNEYIEMAAKLRGDSEAVIEFPPAAVKADVNSTQDLELKTMTSSHDPLASSLAEDQKDSGRAMTAEAKIKDEIQAADAKSVTPTARIKVSRLKAPATDAEAGVKWDSIELSDDDGWEKVIGDGDSDWEVLEE